jgi:hypothetical protein
MKGVDWSMTRKVPAVVDLLMGVALGYLYTIVTTLIAEKVPPRRYS